MSTLEWIMLVSICVLTVGNSLYFYRAAYQRIEEARIIEAYIRKSNRDFAEAAALLKYGATQEAIDLLAKYDREGTE